MLKRVASKTGSASDGDLDASVDVPADSPFHAALDVVRGAPNARDEIWPPKARGTYRVWANDASYSDSVILERTMQQVFLVFEISDVNEKSFYVRRSDSHDNIQSSVFLFVTSTSGNVVVSF